MAWEHGMSLSVEYIICDVCGALARTWQEPSETAHFYGVRVPDDRMRGHRRITPTELHFCCLECLKRGVAALFKHHGTLEEMVEEIQVAVARDKRVQAHRRGGGEDV